MKASKTTLLQELADRTAIQDTLIRYSTALDTRNFKLLEEVFTEDAFIDYSSSGGVQGNWKDLKDWLQQTLSRFSSWQHLLSNMVITIEGDKATARTDVYNPLAYTDEEGKMQVMHAGAYYKDRLIRTSAGWRISERRLELVWLEGTMPSESKP